MADSLIVRDDTTQSTGAGQSSIDATAGDITAEDNQQIISNMLRPDDSAVQQHYGELELVDVAVPDVAESEGRSPNGAVTEGPPPGSQRSCPPNATYNEMMRLMLENVYGVESLNVNRLNELARQNACLIQSEDDVYRLANDAFAEVVDQYTNPLRPHPAPNSSSTAPGQTTPQEQAPQEHTPQEQAPQEHTPQEQHAPNDGHDHNSTPAGIGVRLEPYANQEEGRGPLTVQRVLDGGPADEAGLQAGDRIVAVDGQDISNELVNDTAAKIRGEEGTDVTLTIERDGERFDVQLTREHVRSSSVGSELLEGNVLYLRLDDFRSVTTAEELFAAIQRYQSGVEGPAPDSYILDLRNNPGGYTYEAAQTASIFMDQGVVTQLEVRLPGDRTDPQYVEQVLSLDPGLDHGVVENTIDGRPAVDPDLPTEFGILQDVIDDPVVVLVNGNSASAAELLAGALHDNDAAVLMGEQTFGKGVQQRIVSNEDGSVTLKVTNGRYYTPDGTWPGDGDDERIGLTPDVTVANAPGTILTTEEDVQLQAALDLLANEGAVLPQ